MASAYDDVDFLTKYYIISVFKLAIVEKKTYNVIYISVIISVILPAGTAVCKTLRRFFQCGGGQILKGDDPVIKSEKITKKKERQKTKLGVRLSIPILLVVVFQLLTFLITMAVGGEFRDIRQYAYSTLLEKTENRYNYIRDKLQEKPALVQEYSEQINNLVASILEERGETINEIRTDKELNYSIIESSVETLSSLLRRAQVNDAYVILETGELYAEESGGAAKAALYLRAVDPKSSSGFRDLLMEIGYASLSQNYGITRHSGWAPYFEPDPGNMKDFDFYYKTMDTALENKGLTQNNLGYWSSFSRASSMTTPSMKYTVPLTYEDGTVYGVLGVGLTESNILSNIPSRDFLSETACYVLGRSTSEDTFDVLTYSGSAYNTLLGSSDTLHVDSMEDEIYNFDQVTDVVLIGSVQFIDLYGQNSPYRAEQWALISVADRSTVLRPLLFLRQMLLISTLISLLVAGIIAFLSCVQLIKPISGAIKLMSDKQKYNETIHFQPSYIYEIDKMTDAITQLQVNSQKFSSQVSRMIRIADVGLGTYMYSHTEDSVFVGQSFQKFQKPQARVEQDTVMSRQEFLDSIFEEKLRGAVQSSMERLGATAAHEDHSTVCQIDSEDSSIKWVRLSTVYAEDQSIGILQDITEMMMEQKRIEYERDYDRLTGLLNRQSYYRKIEDQFRNKDQLKITAFIMLDLDNLKYVNDTYGHDFGDDYIRTAAKVLKKFQNYGGIVARISGDEFNVCLPGFSTKEEVREIINEIREEMRQSSCLLADGTHFKIRSSMGISWYPDDADSFDMLMKYADFAMYTIKHSTKGGTAEFDINSYATDSVLLTGVEEMNSVIEEGRVRYAFQSIVSARTGEIFGYEALMRVQSKIFQSPLELMRAAKAGARLYDIELLTWRRSVTDFLTQVEAGRIAKDTYVFINSIANIRLNPDDERSLFENGYPDLRIVAEILESEDAANSDIVQKYGAMKKGGAKIALDDFGTGYNSEYTLLAIQPDIIKIDRSIISGCDKDASRRMIINNRFNLAHSNDIMVVAEGVETQEELKMVIACGVDLIQGYYLSYPLFEPEPLDPEIVDMIRRLNAPDDPPKGGI